MTASIRSEVHDSHREIKDEVKQFVKQLVTNGVAEYDVRRLGAYLVCKSWGLLATKGVMAEGTQTPAWLWESLTLREKRRNGR